MKKFFFFFNVDSNFFSMKIFMPETKPEDPLIHSDPSRWLFYLLILHSLVLKKLLDISLRREREGLLAYICRCTYFQKHTRGDEQI